MQPKEVKLKPECWNRILKVGVVDPDGWRSDGQSWDKPINFSEFVWRASTSTRKIEANSTFDEINRIHLGLDR